MARAIWSGTLSFGLLNIPVSLMTGERRTTNVVDFMSLLQKSIATDKRTPAKKAVEEVVDEPPERRAAKTARKKSSPKKKTTTTKRA